MGRPKGIHTRPTNWLRQARSLLLGGPEVAKPYHVAGALKKAYTKGFARASYRRKHSAPPPQATV